MKDLDQRFREAYDTEGQEKDERDSKSRAREFAKRLLQRITNSIKK